jgi:hypothetical protein
MRQDVVDELCGALAMRRPPQLGQKPRRLLENGTSVSA